MAATTALWRNGRIGYRVKTSDKERLRQRLRRMSNPELLLFGVTSKISMLSGTEIGLCTAKGYPRTSFAEAP